MGGIIGVRSLQFIEERLEQGLAPRTDADPAPAVRGAAATRGDHETSAGGRRVAEFGTMVCEVGGFRGEFADTTQLAAMCEDIRSMLGRRLRVHAVVAEPLAPGRLLVILRTQPLEPSLKAMVENGLTWYLEDQKTRYSADAAFPRIRWVRTAADDQDGRTSREAAHEGRDAPRARSVRERRPSAVRS